MSDQRMSIRPDVGKTMAVLKDFQRDTAEYVFRRLYSDQDRVSRFLIADEVGLGKTLVARGVIAQAIDHLWDDIDRIDVVYICSNQDIARQNIDRLNIATETGFQLASRATLLPIHIKDLRCNKLNFISLTPGTSFNLKSRTGNVWERSLLFYLLRDIWDVQDGVLSNVLRGAAHKKNWKYYLQSFHKNSTIDDELRQSFYDLLATKPSIREKYETLEELIGSRRTRLHQEVRWIRDSWTSDLRRLLAESSLSALEPDLIIMDEFQRFRSLLDPENEIAILAQALFDYSEDTHADGAKTLLLSATPYKMYTLHNEVGEDHYRDFFETVRFLLHGDPKTNERLKRLVQNYRDALFNFALDGQDEIFEIKSDIERILKKVIVRTERLAASANRSGMLKDHTRLLLDEIHPGDVQSFIHYDRLASALNARDQVEYWKSSAYPINIMDGYKFKNAFQKELDKGGNSHLAKIINSAQEHLLQWSDIQAYKQIDPANARLRALIKQTIETGNWKLLWLPPSMPYYVPGSVFSEVEEDGLTKSLIFSSWKLVPKMIAMMLSYEAERRIIEFGGDEDLSYTELTVRRKGLLNFAFSNERLTGMPILCLVYPCVTLALGIDPLHIARYQANGNQLTREEMKSVVRDKLSSIFENAIADVDYEQDGVIDERWYWAALAFLDRASHSGSVSSWFADIDSVDSLRRLLDRADDDEGSESRYVEHIEFFERVFQGDISFGKMPDDLLDVLAEIAIASPAVTSLRSLLRLPGFNMHPSGTVLAAAARIGFGYRSLFNTPEATTFLQKLYLAGAYWEKALRYCVEGNLQAVLDEYIHILYESLGLSGHAFEEVAEKISKVVRESISVRSASLRFDHYKSEDGKKIEVSKQSIRTRYAARFGDESVDHMGVTHRADEIRLAFNSPFRPFVLATTSVGQEGLDFHQYAHRVIHWNLPSNPVDLEQREGRVHRYKGHVIRRNLAKAFNISQLNLDADQKDPWEALFSLALEMRADGVNDLIPYWIFEIEDGYAIDRLIPLLPLSREVGFADRLKRSVVYYRSVMGQPRQDDLIDFLGTHFSGRSMEKVIERLRIDLSPDV